jgi:hypothetical protein
VADHLKLIDTQLTAFAPDASLGTTYMPDDRGPSLVLVLYVRGPAGERGHVETLASLGSHVDYAFEVDQRAVEEDWAEGMGRSGVPEGLHVLTCSWHGSGEDSELLVESIRPLDTEEREHIKDNGAAEAVVHAWMLGMTNVKCRCCGRPGAVHTDFALSCPPSAGGAPPVEAP